MYTDGSAKPHNPGHGGYGVVFYNSGSEFDSASGYLGDNVSNNQAEYMALVVALAYIKKNMSSSARVTVFSDSLLVVQQVLGNWKLRSRKLVTLHAKAGELASDIVDKGINLKLEHIRGHMGIVGNERADELAGLAVDDRVEPSPWVTDLMSKEVSSVVEERGFEKLDGLVTGVLKDHGHMMTPLGSRLGASDRTRLYQAGDVTSMRLLNLPSMAVTIGRRFSVLVAYTTRFHMAKGGADRAMELDSIVAAKALTEAGMHVLVVHKPHSNGRWRTFKDLGWSTVDRDVPASCAMAGDLKIAQVHKNTKWTPFASLDGEWTSFITWLKTAEERYG